MSACAISSCALNRSPLIPAMPMLHCRLNTRSCSTCFTLRMSSSTWVATAFASCRLMSLSSTTNSSPPKRATKSSVRTPWQDLLSGKLQQIVTGRVTARVVHVLELIEVDEEKALRRLLSRAGHDLRLELRDQPVTVVEPRERIVVGEMEQVPLSLTQRPDGVLERRHDREDLGVPRAREFDLLSRPRRAGRAAFEDWIAAQASDAGITCPPPRRRRAATTARRSRTRDAGTTHAGNRRSRAR